MRIQRPGEWHRPLSPAGVTAKFLSGKPKKFCVKRGQAPYEKNEAELPNGWHYFYASFLSKRTGSARMRRPCPAYIRTEVIEMMLLSVRISRKVRVSAGLLVLLLAVIMTGRAVVSLFPQDQPASAEIKKQAGKTEEQRQEFAAGLGWQISAEPVEVEEVVVPKEFDEVYEKYNQIQLDQGLGLQRLRGKRMKRYSYEVLNYPGQSENVRLNLLVYNGKIVGGDVCSMELDGFMHGLMMPAAGTGSGQK